jgi:hypothetical protein
VRVRHQEPAAAQVARFGVHDREREGDGDRRVHRVASLGEHVGPHARRAAVRADDHAVPRDDRPSTRRERPRGRPVLEALVKRHGL